MPTPKSILLHLDSSSRCAERVKLARRLADEFHAQVTAMYGAMPALLRYPPALDASGAALATLVEIDRACRNKAQAAFTAACAGSPRLKWSESDIDVFNVFTRRSLYADLLILGQRDAADPGAGELPADFVPSLLVGTGRPALVLPYAGDVGTIGSTVLIAWKETRESARALAAALPWLHRAVNVHAACFGAEARSSLQSLQDYLNAQGLALSLHAGEPEHGDVGESLLSLAADLHADLLVMGGYGRSRAREWVLGGATRTILQSMTLPTLMVH